MIHVYEIKIAFDIFLTGKPTTTTTTTTLAPPPFRPDLTPLYAAVGGVLGVALLLWCCWKPAYLPWRLGRCRNYPCWVKCGNLCPCLKCRACFPGRNYTL